MNNTINTGRIDMLEDFVDAVAPFLRRLQEPRYDKYETNDYICGSTECKRALEAMRKYDAVNSVKNTD